MKNIPKPVMIIIVAVFSALFLAVIGYFAYDYFTDGGTDPETPGTEEPDRRTIKKKEITLTAPDKSGSVTFTVEVVSGTSLNLYPSGDQSRAVIEDGDMKLELTYTDLGSDRYEIEKYTDSTKLDNFQLDDIFRITTEDENIFYVYPLTDELECERIFALESPPVKYCGENRIRYMNYKPIRIEYVGDPAQIASADRILESLTFTKTEGVTTENTRQIYPVEYWKGDGGYLQLSSILPQNTVVTLGGNSAEAETQIGFSESIISVSIPRNSNLIRYKSERKVGRLDGRDLYRHQLKDSNDYYYISDLVDEGRCSDGENEVSNPCGGNLLLIEDKGFYVKFTGLESDLPAADQIVLTMLLEGLVEEE